MGVEPGKPLLDHPIDVVFIGSCTNSRLSDLRAAAQIFKGRKVSPTVKAVVVPGSQQIKKLAEEEGLDQDFQGSRRGLARIRLQHVHCNERRQAGTRTGFRQHQQSQL